MAPAIQAQDHVIGQSTLDQAVQQRVSQEQADRDAIRSVLQRAEVRDIAAKVGISVEKAQAAVSTLQGKDLQQAAQQARQVQNDLAGGATSDVISNTSNIRVLLLVILKIAIAD
jgi:predicted DsbA family dithiol-disulfide isomerase